MDSLKRPHFLEELTGKVHLTQCDAVASIKPALSCRTLEAQRGSLSAAMREEMERMKFKEDRGRIFELLW